MPLVSAEQKDSFFQDVEEAAKKAIWCAIATVDGTEPRVRLVHPTWEDDVLWIATGPETAKARQIQSNSAVDVQFQVAPDDFVHLLVRGTATVLTDQATKERVWDVMDYDLSQFWPAGSSDPGYCLIKIVPSRVELSKMFGTTDVRVYKS
ncbi:MAG: general stress protein 26 [Halioglobus sp.]|jgi:general stress protein 26